MFSQVRLICLPVLCVLALQSESNAQATRQLPSTVQLPTFSSFGYSGTVLVPVQGATQLGGVSRSSSGRNGGRSFGGSASHVGAGVRATIIDHDAIDRQLRGLPPRSTSGSRVRTSTKVSASGKTTASAKDPDAEGKALVRYARKQYLEGRKESSFGAYNLAISKLSPKLAALARKEMERVFDLDRR